MATKPMQGSVPAPERAYGIGIATRRSNGEVLDVWFPKPQLGDSALAKDPWLELASFEKYAKNDPVCNVERDVLLIESQLQTPATSVADVYLRLHLLSHRLIQPNTINLDGIFSLLPTVVFTNRGVIHIDDFNEHRSALQQHGVSAHSLDKFPRLIDYYAPEGVRIADANRVRLGAYLSPGTTVMHEGFVNFNAGTLGPAMVEGRISHGVVIGEGSDIGGGASIMGTLSGGGRERISIGKRTLLGANSGIGISLGDDCVVEAGLYVTAGSRITVIEQPGSTNLSNQVIKAIELSGSSGVLFRRNSQTGTLEALSRSGSGIELNRTLHA